MARYVTLSVTIDRAMTGPAREDALRAVLRDLEALGLIAIGTDETEGWPRVMVAGRCPRRDPARSERRRLMLRWLGKMDDFMVETGVVACLFLILAAVIGSRGCAAEGACKPSVKVMAPSWIRSPSFKCDHPKHEMKIDKSWRAVTVTCECRK